MKTSTVFFATLNFLVLSLFSSAVIATDNPPRYKSYTLSQTEKETLALLKFCTVLASTSTYNHIFGGSTHSERGSIICENEVVLYFGDQDAPIDEGQRSDEILATLMGQMQTLGFKVISCVSNKSSQKCTLAKETTECSEDSEVNLSRPR